jgi:CBS domain-containing protein
LKPENKLLRDVMTRGVVTVHMDATVKQIAMMLSKQGLSGVAVIDNQGSAMGVISGMDILKVMGKKNWESIMAESIMTSRMETAKPTCTIAEAARMMREKNIHRLLVLSETGIGVSQKPIGILSTSDIVREAARD